MNDECPNCRQQTNTSFSRLVTDSCGHTKCRMCLLYEERGCNACNHDHDKQRTGVYDCPSSKKILSDAANSIDNKIDISNKETVLPLELVIHKDSKPKTNCIKVISHEYINETKDNIFTNKTNTYNSIAIDINAQCSTNKLYMPKVESCAFVSSIHAHLNNVSDSIDNAQLSYDETSMNTNNLKTKSDFAKKQAVLKNKHVKGPDRTHISVIPGNPEKYKCNICSKIFRNKKGKCYHDACITGIKPYQCTFCDRSFVKRSHFEYHERIHSGYKPFKCNLCEKAFPQQNKLNRHMYSHSKQKQFMCPKCDKGYSKREDLKSHLNIHNGAATYSCKLCEKTFRVLANLKRHMRTHSNERPYVCDQCNKSFKDKSLLIRHKRTHGKERPFSCAHCNRVFLSKSELRRHLTVHSDEKPFSCEYCQTVFRRKDNLNRHIRHHHLEDTALKTNKFQNTLTEVHAKIVKTKQVNLRQRQKARKAQRITSNNLSSRSPTKVSMVYVRSRDQINSRLDSMGNVTTVIRATNEVSNAVPVINGPISIRKHEDKTDTRKKTFTYTEPIPLAEAVVINRRIEEKLYPQNVSNESYFFRSCLNCTEKSYGPMNQASRTSSNTKNSLNKMILYENESTESIATCDTNILHQKLIPTEFVKDSVIEKHIFGKKNIECQKKGDGIHLLHNSNPKYIVEKITVNENNHTDVKCVSNLLTPTMEEQNNCISTIKVHAVEPFNSGISLKTSCINNHIETASISLPKKHEDSSENKNINLHWRRRTAEVLKPCDL